MEKRWEGGSGWGTHINPWLIHVNVWQKPLQYCKVISLQLIIINEKKNGEDYLFLVPILYIEIINEEKVYFYFIVLKNYKKCL